MGEGMGTLFSVVVVVMVVVRVRVNLPDRLVIKSLFNHNYIPSIDLRLDLRLAGCWMITAPYRYVNKLINALKCCF